MDRKEKAIDHKHNGCNCCQSVLLAFADKSGMAEEDLKRLGSAFGGGMGCMEGTCGALSGAGIILGLNKYQGKPVGRDAAALHKSFTEKCGASICKDLKGRDTGVVVCGCDDCVRNAVAALEEVL